MKQHVIQHGIFRQTNSHLSLWFRWVFANTWGELLGLGMVFMVGAFCFSMMQGKPSVMVHLIMAALMIVAGGGEGVIVGFAQSGVLKEVIQSFKKDRWIIATVIGAVAAWILGMIPSILMSFGEDQSAAQPTEIGEVTVAMLAATMGFVLGIILGLPQWHVLKKYVNKAGWWLPANGLAWAIGMPQLFVGIGAAYDSISVWQTIFLIAASIVSTGASVGVIHGFFLLWLLKSPRQASG